MDSTSASSSQTRSTSGSVRPHGSRSADPDRQISQIEKSVTHLLVATKQLLETLTQWSRGNAQEEEVSDVYVRLGYEFNLACRAFNSIGVETSDLGPVPDLLRSILEDTLSQPASPQSLDNYLPRIRDIIINLLHGLKRKQSKLRSRSAKDGSSRTAAAPARQTSVGSVASNDTGITTTMENLPSSASSVRSESRQESVRSPGDSSWITSPMTNGFDRGSVHRNSARRQNHLSEAKSATTTPVSNATSTFSQPSELETKLTPIETPFPHPPPPPPKQDALTALQRGGDLERRASRRFSAYQIQKHLGASSNGIPVLPPAQNSPIPNRGREVRESMSAVRSRTILQPSRQRSANRLAEISPDSPGTIRSPPPISEEEEEQPAKPAEDKPKVDVPPPELADGNESPTVKTPEEFKSRQPMLSVKSSGPEFAATVSGPLSPAPEEFLAKPQNVPQRAASPATEAVKTDFAAPLLAPEDRALLNATPTKQEPVLNGLDSSPPQSKELTLFLQYKSKIKKFVLGEGYDELTMARLQLAFIEKFNWNTHNNGVDLPEIYIQDSVSGVRYELDDLTDIKDRSVLVLNVEVLDEVKKHFDEGIGGLKTSLDGVRALLDGQGSLMQRFSDRQLEASKEMARLSAAPAPRPTQVLTVASLQDGGSVVASEASMTEVQNLRRDIAVLRQTYATMSSDFAATMKDIKSKAETVKIAASQAVAPSYEGDAGRAHVNQGKTTLNADSEALVNRVDDLTDIVEELRKDVVSRGVRPLPRQLEDINREIVATTKDYQKMKEFIKREKPIWTKVWEHELDLVCTERDDLTQREELMADMDMDIEEVTSVFKLVEEAMKQQNQSIPGQAGLRSVPRSVDIDPSIDPQAAKDGVLHEVRALRPNHEGRLEAIERAEKARQKELGHRKVGEFQREVANFVEEGRLKKTGGMEEVERLRKIKDERARKDIYELKEQRAAELEKKRAERAAAKAAAAAAAAASDSANGSEATTVIEAQDEQLNETTVATETSLPDANASETTHDTPQGESFQDAEEHNSATEVTIEPQQRPETPTVPVDEHSSATHDTQRSETPKLESEADEGHARDSPVKKAGSEKDKTSVDIERPASTNSNRQSWWKPAIFNP